MLSVEKDKVRHLTNDQNPVDYLKLSGKKGVWAGLGGKAKAGRGVVVGVLDTGYWPESASFAGKPVGHQATHQGQTRTGRTRPAARSG